VAETQLDAASLKDRALSEIIDLDHVQLAMPAGQEAAPRAF